MNVSKDVVPYLNITTHLDDTTDQGLLSEKGGSGFPTLFFMEPETGAVLNEWWWPEDEATVRDAIAKATEKAKGLQDLLAKAKASPEDKVLQASVAIKLAMMRAGDTPMEELAKLAMTEGLDPELKAEFDAWYAGALVQQVVDSASEGAESRDEFYSGCQSGFYKLLKEGVRLPADHDMAQMYYDLGLNGAIEASDKTVAQAAFDGYKAAMDGMAKTRPDAADQIKSLIEKAKARLDGIGQEKSE